MIPSWYKQKKRLTITSNNTKYYPALDGLRGLAILLVIFHHNFRFVHYFLFGWLGVDLFFVLSGFLITDILLQALGKPDFLKNFYIRRVLRIFPVFYAALIICLFILPSINKLHLDVSYYKENQGWLWFYLQNWLFIFKEPHGDKILLHTWSLAVEEQFYLVWPLVILLVRKPRRLIMLVLVVLIAVVVARYILWSMQIKGLAYSSLYTFTRIDGLCIGCILALLLRNNAAYLKKFMIVIVLFTAAVNFGFYFVNSRNGYSLPYLAFAGYTTFAVLFAILTYEAVMGGSKIIQLIFTNRVLRFFGKISYGLYVYHWPVYILLFDYSVYRITERGLASDQMAQFISGLIVTAVAILISTISYRYFERPLLKLKERFK